MPPAPLALQLATSSWYAASARSAAARSAASRWGSLLDTPLALPAAGGIAGGELEAAQLALGELRTLEGVVLALGEQLPGKAGELAGDRHRRYLVAATRAYAGAEGAQRTGLADRLLGGLDQRRPCLAGPCLEILPWRASPEPDWRTRGSSPR